MHPMILGFLALTKEVRIEEFYKMVRVADDIIVKKDANEVGNMMLLLSAMVAVLPTEESYPSYLKDQLVRHVEALVATITDDDELAKALQSSVTVLKTQMSKHDHFVVASLSIESV